MKAKSDAWYVKRQGVICPYCESDLLEGGAVEIEGGLAFQEIFCLSCGKTWTDKYKLIGYIKGE